MPIAREDYYFWQSLFVVPLLLGVWLLAAWAAQAVARKLGGYGRYLGTANVLGLAFGLPLVLVLIVPDLVVYESLGFSALGRLIRVTAPVSFVLTICLATIGVRAAHGLATGKALAVAWVFVLTQALVGGVFLR